MPNKRKLRPSRNHPSRSKRPPILASFLVATAVFLLTAVIFVFAWKYLQTDKTDLLSQNSRDNTSSHTKLFVQDTSIELEEAAKSESGQNESYTSPPEESAISLDSQNSNLAEGASGAETLLETTKLESKYKHLLPIEGLFDQDKEKQAGLKAERLNPNFDPASLSSQSYVLADVEIGLVLASKNPREQLAPASLTKVMTALLTLEHYDNLDQRVEILAEDVGQFYELGASVAGFPVGSTPTVRDLIYGMMLPSGADACYAAARDISGSVDKFVELMNERAQELGLASTHFTNPTGLPEAKLYSTAEDMARLFYVACQNETFVEIAGANYYEIPGLGPEGGPLGLTSTFIWKYNSDPNFQTNLLAGKSGFTGSDQAQASLFSKNRKEYILVNLGVEVEDANSHLAVQEQVRIMNELLKD